MSYLREIVDARDLLANLTLRDVRGQYRRTILGQVWSLVNPLAQMLIFTFVFAFIFRIQPPPGDPSGLDIYALWLMCALLPWTFFSRVLQGTMGSIVGNAGLIQKVYFTRIVLPLSQVGSIGFTWLFEMLILVIALTVVGGWVIPWIPLVLVFMVLLAMFAAGIGLMLGIANVHFRDTEHFVGILLQIWMYLTPIIYPISLMQAQSDAHGGLFGTPITIMNIYSLNPLEHFASAFRALMYDNTWPTVNDSLVCVLAACISLLVGMLVFRRNERGLAEAL